MRCDMKDEMFRELSADEQVDFRRWARVNYKAGQPINEVWHPVTRDECDIINRETPVTVAELKEGIKFIKKLRHHKVKLWFIRDEMCDAMLSDMESGLNNRLEYQIEEERREKIWGQS
jgi:hypothetical protein